MTLGETIRYRFPVFEHRTYLNSCSQGALSDAVRAAYESYLGTLEAEGSLWGEWVDRTEQLRRAYAQLLHAAPDSIAVTTSASAGVASIASALDFGERNTVVTTDLEFPTIGQIWHAQETPWRTSRARPARPVGRDDRRPNRDRIGHPLSATATEADPTSQRSHS